MENKQNNITDSLTDDLPEVKNNLMSAENYRITYIPIEQLIPSSKNKYALNEISALAASIQDEGLNQPIVVRTHPENKDNYEIIYGHRRRLAILSNIENGDDRYKKVPCLIKEITDDVDMEITLINGNATNRELSEPEKMHQVVRLKELYRIKRERGDTISGRIRQKIAEDLHMSPTAVGRYETIEKNLIPELKDQFEKGDIRMSTAAELATKSQDDQKTIYENNVDNQHLKLTDVKKKKAPNKPAEPLPVTTVLQKEDDKIGEQLQPKSLSPAEIVRNNKTGEKCDMADCRVASFLTNYINSYFKMRGIHIDKVTRFFKDDNLLAIEVSVDNKFDTYRILGDKILKISYNFSESVGLV